MTRAERSLTATGQAVVEMSERGRTASRAEIREAWGRGGGKRSGRLAAQGRAEQDTGGARQGDDRAAHCLTDGTVRAPGMTRRAQLRETRSIRRDRGLPRRDCRSSPRARMPVRQPVCPEQRELRDDEPDRQRAAAGCEPGAARMVHGVSPPFGQIIQIGTRKCNPQLAAFLLVGRAPRNGAAAGTNSYLYPTWSEVAHRK
jgi:hypothetical protein